MNTETMFVNKVVDDCSGKVIGIDCLSKAHFVVSVSNFKLYFHLKSMRIILVKIFYFIIIYTGSQKITRPNNFFQK